MSLFNIKRNIRTLILRLCCHCKQVGPWRFDMLTLHQILRKSSLLYSTEQEEDWSSSSGKKRSKAFLISCSSRCDEENAVVKVTSKILKRKNLQILGIFEIFEEYVLLENNRIHGKCSFNFRTISNITILTMVSFLSSKFTMVTFDMLDNMLMIK